MNIQHNDIGALVRNARKSYDLTQSELAKRANCSQRLISELENGSEGIAFGKVLDVLAALQIGLSAQAIPIEDPRAEIKALEEKVVKQLSKSTRPKRTLKDYL